MSAQATRPSTLRTDLLSAYAVTAARLTAWLVVSALVFRHSREQYALLVLVRATIGVLNYTALGLAPAMIHSLAKARAAVPLPVQPVDPDTLPPAVALEFADPYTTLDRNRLVDATLRRLYANGLVIALLTGIVGTTFVAAYATFFTSLHRTPPEWQEYYAGVVAFLGLGSLVRLMSDAPGALLQAHGRITLDNVLLVIADVAWVALCLIFSGGLQGAVGAYFLSSVLLAFTRLFAADLGTYIPANVFRLADRSTIRALLGFGSLVALAQVADYLYAPTDYILINRLLTATDVATYAPAVQIDAGLLLLVSGLAAVLLPTTALAHAAGDAAAVRRYYVRGTLASAALLVPAAVLVYLLSPILFRAWLGSPLPATRAILPLVLVHTVIGGTSAVGRSVLLATGRVRPFTTAVLAAGATNVLCSYAFVQVFHLGLRGIILGTIVAVVGRCAVWMPWYVWRSVKESMRVDEPLLAGPPALIE